MKRVKCPFCGRRFTRSHRALLENRFCSKCIPDRIRKSGATIYETIPGMVETSPGYFAVAPKTNT